MTSEGVKPDLVELHALFRGRVQGVGFRGTVRHNADKLGLVGSVKNLSDGTVELYAQGPESVLELLLRNLESDAGLGHVEGVTKDYRKPSRQFDEFSIVF